MNMFKEHTFEWNGEIFTLIQSISEDPAGNGVALDGFLLYPQDKSFTAELSYHALGFDAKRFLSLLLEDGSGYHLIGEIRPIHCGNSDGYRCSYEDGRSFYEEYAFDRKNGRKHKGISITVSVKNSDGSYDESIKKKVVSELFNYVETW